MTSPSEDDDVMTPQQKTSLLVFIDAFNEVFKEEEITLRDILILDQTVETVVGSKKIKGTSPPDYSRMTERLPQVPRAKTLPWYERDSKAPKRDWQGRTVTQRHDKRGTFGPCHHIGPCATANKCLDVLAKILCKRFCQCIADNSSYKFTVDSCHSSGMTCHEQQR
jgi:hypothetical protein